MTDATQKTFAEKLESLCEASGSFGTVKYGVTKSSTLQDEVFVPFIEVGGVRVEMTDEEAKKDEEVEKDEEAKEDPKKKNLKKVVIDFYRRPGNISEHAQLEFYPIGKGWRVDRYEGKNIGRFTGYPNANGKVRLKTDEEIRERLGRKTGTLGKRGQWEEVLPNSWSIKKFSIEEVAPTIDDTSVTNVTSLGVKRLPEQLNAGVSAVR